jgi:hypothetical protein
MLSVMYGDECRAGIYRSLMAAAAEQFKDK